MKDYLEALFADSLGLMIGFLGGAAAWANPTAVGPPEVPIYLDSEKVSVNITDTEAVFTGSFMFAAKHATHNSSEADSWQGARSLIITTYIWFPEESQEDMAVAEFWRIFAKSGENALTRYTWNRGGMWPYYHQGDDSLTTNTAALFDRVVGLRISVGGRHLELGRDINSFFATPYVKFDLEKERFFSELYKALGEPEPETEDLGEPGFCLLSVYFHDDGTIVRDRLPVRISYRQPLARLKGTARFFYRPVFEHKAEGFSTADTNRYSITITASGCRATITNGTQTAIIQPGRSALFTPHLYEPLRGVCEPVPDKPNPAASQ